MAKQVKRVYRALAWFFSVVVAAGTLIGCRETQVKYGPWPADTKYGPPAYNSPQKASKIASVPTKDVFKKVD